MWMLSKHAFTTNTFLEPLIVLAARIQVAAFSPQIPKNSSKNKCIVLSSTCLDNQRRVALHYSLSLYFGCGKLW